MGVTKRLSKIINNNRLSYISYVNSGRSEFYKNFSAKDKLQGLAFNQMKINFQTSETENEKKFR